MRATRFTSRLTPLILLAATAAASAFASACAGGGARSGDSARDSTDAPAPVVPQPAAPDTTAAAPPAPTSSAAGTRLRFARLDAPLGDAELGVSREGGTVTVRGNILTPSPCQTLDGSLETPGDTIRVVVAAAPDDSQVCAQVLGNFGYRIVLDRIPSGQYVVVVQHQTRNRMMNERPVTERITIP